MRVIAAAWADLGTTFLGTRSRLGERLDGVPILRRTVDRLVRADRVSAIFILCPPDQAGACRDILHGTKAVVQAVQADPPPWAGLVRAARKWSLDGWRGGLGGTASFDEFTDARILAGLLAAEPADAILSFPAAAPLLDAVLADRMIAHAEETGEDSRLVFTQAPPGVAGILLRSDLISELADKQIALGWLFAYKPNDPLKDLIFLSSLCEVPQDLRYATGRLIADTDRSIRTVGDLLRDRPVADVEAIGQWLAKRETEFVERVPREIEIELTTDDPYPETTLRPRGDRVLQRGPIDPAIAVKVGEALAAYDDSLVVLGGFGDPLRHPHWQEVVRALRSVRSDQESSVPFGLALRTTGVDLSDENIAGLLSTGVDVLQVSLDAWTPELYGQLQSPGDPPRARLADVLARIDRLEEIRRAAGSATPIVLPDFTKSRDNVQELDAFHDGWLRRLGAVSVTGVSYYGGRQPDLRVMSMAPPRRSSCRRLRSRCLVLADGRVTLCDQDYAGDAAIGSLGEHSLEDLWTGVGIQRVRNAHQDGQFNVTSPCANCDEWHRP